MSTSPDITFRSPWVDMHGPDEDAQESSSSTSPSYARSSTRTRPTKFSANGMLNPLHFSSQQAELSRPRSPGTTFDLRAADNVAHKSSVSKPGSSTKGKRSVDNVDPSPVANGNGIHDADMFSAARSNTSVSLNTPQSRPSTADPLPSSTKKPRHSILVSASDALSFKFGKKRKPIKQTLPPLILPEVIEITSPRRDEEVEERERLRDAAAQSIGLGLGLLQDTQSRKDSSTLSEQDPIYEDDENAGDSRPATRDGEYKPGHGSMAHVSTSSQSVTSKHLTRSLMRSHSGTTLTHSRRNSVVATAPFPATMSALLSYKQKCSTLPKYYPPSSLLVYALSKQWKTRHIILTSPPASGSRSAAAVSYLHLFKSSSSEEREIERLEINEDSVVFVADEEVGGRGNVIKVGGVDVGAMKKDFNHEEQGRTMWFLQIIDSSESQEWIGIIKTAILSQRSVRAGLSVPIHNPSSIEPRGDMDVMLSMRLQGIIPSSLPAKSGNTDSRSVNTAVYPASGHSGQTVSPPTSRPSSPPQSTRSHSTSPKPSSGHPVSTLKGLFSGSGRPRSPSQVSQDKGPDQVEDSFGSMGNSLLTMLKTNGTGDASMAPSHAHIHAHPHARPSSSSTLGSLSGHKKISTFPLSVSHADHAIDRKIASDLQDEKWLSPQTNGTTSRSNRALSVGSMSLHPAPRKKVTPEAGAPAYNGPTMYRLTSANRSMAGSFGVRSSTEVTADFAPTSPPVSSRSSSTSGQKGRAPSLHSVSTYASAEVGSTMDVSVSSKRWSRQGTLPKRLTPPSGPPPATPRSQVETKHASLLKPQQLYPSDRPSSRGSSQHSGNTPPSAVSASPNFWKRASNSSAYSVSTVSTSNSRGVSVLRSGSTKRLSLPPPPRPAPNFALPLTPPEVESELKSDPPKKTHRDSVTKRALRLSLTAAKPPPSTTLPLRPDEPGYKSHRKSTSSGNSILGTILHPIPASPTPPGQLPPASAGSALARPVSPPVPSRATTFKQRLRILSAPSPVMGSQDTQASDPYVSYRASPKPSTQQAYSPPATPIGEPITTMQNDPNFLQMSTPTSPIMNIPSLPLWTPERPSLPPPLSSTPELTPLSPPPPRRSSRQIVPPEKVAEISDHHFSDTNGESKSHSLSQTGSVVSLGIVAM